MSVKVYKSISSYILLRTSHLCNSHDLNQVLANNVYSAHLDKERPATEHKAFSMIVEKRIEILHFHMEEKNRLNAHVEHCGYSANVVEIFFSESITLGRLLQN